MTTHSERVEIVCPCCGRSFAAWCRPGAAVLGGDDRSLHLDLGSASVCSHCGEKVPHHDLVLADVGLWVQDLDRSSAP